MKHLLVSFISINLFLSCTAKQDNIQLEVPESKSVAVRTGQIPAGNPITMMTHDNTNYSWKDVDAYYKGDMQQEKDQPYFKNLKNLAFNALVTVFQMPERAPVEVIAYYVEEQAAMPYTPFVAEFIKCLDKLNGYWPKEKIQQVARERYEKTRSYYLNNEVWKSKWESKKSRYDALLSVK